MTMNDLVKKVTPKQDLTWYIKWVATAFLLIGIISRSAGGPPVFDFIMTIIGGTGWAWVGYAWHDRSILLLNGVVTCILLIGLARVILQ